MTGDTSVDGRGSGNLPWAECAGDGTYAPVWAGVWLYHCPACHAKWGLQRDAEDASERLGGAA